MAAPTDIGDKAIVSNTFSTVAGVATDPTTIVLEYKKPDGTTTSKTYPDTIVKDGTGVYHIDITMDQAGEWRAKWTGTGSLIAASETNWTINPSAF